MRSWDLWKTASAHVSHPLEAYSPGRALTNAWWVLLYEWWLCDRNSRQQPIVGGSQSIPTHEQKLWELLHANQKVSQ